jgi:GT2 family glycosyltransferase
MMVRTDIFIALGGFDTIFDPYGPEDLDFGLRAEKAGYYGLYVPHAVVYHETRPGHTFEGGQYSQTYARTRVKHWFIFMARHARLWEKLVFFILTAPCLAVKVILRELGRGNFSALKGLVNGCVEFAKSTWLKKNRN